jgi:hypothetical protein
MVNREFRKIFERMKDGVDEKFTILRKELCALYRSAFIVREATMSWVRGLSGES